MSLLNRLLSAFCALVLVALVLVPFAQILMRDLVGAAMIGAEELTRFLLIVLVFTAYPLVVMERDNIVMAEFQDLLSDRLRRALTLVITLASLLAAGFIAWVAWETIFKNLNNATPTLKIPFWLFLGSSFFGFAAAALRHLLDLRHPPREETRVF